VLDETLIWQAPVERPDRGHLWDEASTSWIKPSKPFASHVWLQVDGAGYWVAPVDYPQDGNIYHWDEDTTSWVEVSE